MFLSKVILIVNSPSLQFRPTHVTCKKQINIHYLIIYFLPCSNMQYVFVRIFFQSLLILAYHDSSINCVMTAVISLLMFHRKIWHSLIIWYIYPMPYLLIYRLYMQRLPLPAKMAVFTWFLGILWSMLLMLICNSFYQKSLRIFETELNISKFIYQNKEFTDVLHFPDVVVFFIDWQVLCPIC